MANASANGSAGSSPASVDNDSASGGFAMSEQRMRKTPLCAKPMVFLEKMRSQCLYCGIIIPGSYSRVKAHLLRETGKGTTICNAATPNMVT
jgi:hypothetical protein